jgi:hypothetical protein
MMTTPQTFLLRAFCSKEVEANTEEEAAEIFFQMLKKMTADDFEIESVVY